LESIPGFRTQLSPAEFGRVLERCGLALGGQTPQIVPADRKFYALRDATGLVESIPLIASSILSKKLAEGLDGLVLDVKFGSGAFLPQIERGRELARQMVELAAAMGLRASVFLTAMDRPLGRSAGHTLEIAESIECLRGGGPADLRELVETLGAEMLRLAGVARDDADALAQIRAALDDGRALQVFRSVVEAQGGDVRVIDDPTRLARASEVHRLEASRDGYWNCADVRALGNAIIALGGGRQKVIDEIDPTVGLLFGVVHGERVVRGQPLFEVHHSGHGLERALECLRNSGSIDERVPHVGPLIAERILHEGISA
jgi:pyrimidine-nucleoside phosphorylase